MITLLTDFGTNDYFVPAVKGVILTINPSAQLIDITHEIPSHDIRGAAFTLGACFRDFPSKTVHLVVVDPGVGSARRPIVVATNRQLLVGPDNGVFSFVYKFAREARVFHATRNQLFRASITPTFQGRDLFAPLAAHLDRGVDVETVGPQIYDYFSFGIPEPHKDAATGDVVGEILHIDRFGNCITNLTENHLSQAAIDSLTHLVIGSEKVTHFAGCFAEVEGTDRLLAYPGSAGYWEIGLWCDSAAVRLGARNGTPVTLVGAGQHEVSG